jgi:GDYXXLXY protein
MIVAAPLRIGIVCVLGIAALTGLVVTEGRARAAGTEVRLAMQAVDPRSILSGHYVIVAPHRTLQPDETCPLIPQDDANSTDWAAELAQYWIALTPHPEGARVTGIAHTPAEAQAMGPVTVRGSYFCSSPVPPDPPVEPADGIGRFERLDLGVDRFHMSQTDALAIEEVLRNQAPNAEPRVFAIVSIDQHGKARLLGLEVNSQRFLLNWY